MSSLCVARFVNFSLFKCGHACFYILLCRFSNTHLSRYTVHIIKAERGYVFCLHAHRPPVTVRICLQTQGNQAVQIHGDYQTVLKQEEYDGVIHNTKGTDSVRPTDQERKLLHEDRGQNAPNLCFEAHVESSDGHLHVLPVSMDTDCDIVVSGLGEGDGELEHAETPDQEDHDGEGPVLGHVSVGEQREEVRHVAGFTNQNQQQVGQLVP